MGRWDPKFSPEQREALLHACLDLEPNMDVAEAHRRAAAGTLRDGLEPFKISYSRAAQYVREERGKRSGKTRTALARETDPAVVRREFAARCTSILDDELRRVEKGKPPDLDRLRKIAQTARDVDSLARGLAPLRGRGSQPPQGSKGEGDNPPTEGSELVQRMVADAKREGRGTAQPAQTDPPSQAQGSGTPAT